MEESLKSQIQWLVDRALISELLYSFASTLDSKDIAGYVGNYSEEGTLKLPDPTSSTGEYITVHRNEMENFVGNGIMKTYSATHHISTNHQIVITGDGASSRSYLQAVHVGKTATDHWDAGGWYDCTYVKTSGGWKFQDVRLTAIWLSGEPDNIKPA